MELVFTFLLFGIMPLLQLITGIQLFIVARRNNLPNLFWLSAAFVASAIGVAFVDFSNNPLGKLDISKWMINGFIFLINLILIQFIRTTFYQNKPSPHRIFEGIHLLLGAMGFYGLSQSGNDSFSLSPYVASLSISNMLVLLWQGAIAVQSLQSVANDSSVEDWVRARYQLIFWHSATGALYALTNAAWIGLSIKPGVAAALMGLVILLTSIITTILQFLVWVMPEPFRNWLNRNQQKNAEERVHEQAQAVLSILGTSMTEGTGLPMMIALYSIRQVIGMQMNTKESTQIEARVANMGFQDWMETLNHPELYTLIKNSGPKVDPYHIISKTKQILVEKQSLFTMKAK